MNLKKIKFGIIGGGVMGEVLIKSLRQELKISGQNILVMDLHTVRRNSLTRKYQVKNTKEYNDIINNSKIIFLAVKPQQFKQVASQLTKRLSKDRIIISIMAGITLAGIKKRLSHQQVVRTMPNMAAQIGSGITLWMADKSVKQSDRKIIKDVITSFGMEIEVDSDKKIDALTLVTGCGPAYLLHLSGILEDFTKQQGIKSIQAKKIVTEMMAGALVLYLQSNKDTKDLINNMSSKGGVTEAVFDILSKKNKSEKIWQNAFKNALKRTSIISKKYE
ncbi:MAG: pyrroline-5-carboxylate reductase [Candidatus Kerfeldbacteria bacterium]